MDAFVAQNPPAPGLRTRYLVRRWFVAGPVWVSFGQVSRGAR
jgi:hypothetical protein